MVQSKVVKIRKRGPAKRGRSNPRLLAVRVLSSWLAEEPGKRSELEVLGDRTVNSASLSEKDKALFWNILIGTVRWLRLIRWHLDRYIKRFTKLPLDVQAALFIGGYQIIFLSRVPYFSAVNESVEIVRSLGHKWAVGMVNASLRNLARGTKIVPESLEELFERCSKGFENCLANLTSHPHWMVKRWLEEWGRDRCASICINNNIQPPLVLRVNTLKISVEAFMERLEQAGIKGERTQLSHVGVILPEYRGPVGEIPGFKEGFFQVQDESSQLVGLLLDPQKGQRILDVCAGVGGKTTLIAQMIDDEGEITACDINRKRLDLLRENIARLGYGSVRVVALDSKGKGAIEVDAPYDRILVDAPCSGLGVIRRHPDIKWNRIPPAINDLSRVQLEILEKWSPLLRPGGKLVYSVCTLEKEETFGVVKAFLERHGEFSLMDAKLQIPTLPDEVRQEGMLRVFPGTLGMDGFFACILVKGR